MHRVSQRGFTLVEALVALVVLSVGMLGSSALLLASLREQRLALHHSAATALVVDAAERLRANLQGGGPILPVQDLEHFQRAATELFPYQDPQASIIFEPAIGPAIPGRYLVSLRWRDAREGDAIHEVPLTVFAQPPVAG
jgi:type IV pilus assembly protein PilV